MPTGAPGPPLPLAGVLVVDLTQMASGPYATMLLADWGASVVKIEKPGSGDPARSLPPFAATANGRRVAAGALRFGRGKQSLALDLAKPAGRDVFMDLVRVADVVWENFAPGTLERLGLGYDVLRSVKPGLVYACVSGYGRLDGGSAHAARTALDVVAQAASGLMDVTGDANGPPAQVGAVVGDLVPALYGVIGTLLALRRRDLTGEGGLVDISMVDALIAVNERALLATSLTGLPVTRGRLGHAGPYGRFQTADGAYVVIGASIPALWERLCRAIGRQDLLAEAPAADDEGVWWRFGEVVRPHVEQWIASHTADEAVLVLEAAAVPCARVLDAADVLSSAHAQGRQMLLSAEHPVAGSYTAVNHPVRLDGLPAPKAGDVDEVGAHSRDVLRQLLGYSDERIAQLLAEGVVGSP